jgi:hypothetical protein
MGVKEPAELAEAVGRSEAALREAVGDLERTRESILELVDDSPGITVRELANRSGVAEEAVVAFVETLGELLEQRPVSVDNARRAAMLVAAGQIWENELGPLLSSAQVRSLLGPSSRPLSRQRIDELLRARRLIGLLDGSGRRRFPAFQFADGRPLESLVAAYWTVADGAVSDWTAASWCVAPDEALEGRSPVRWASEDRDPERLARVAHQQSARLAQ